MRRRLSLAGQFEVQIGIRDNEALAVVRDSGPGVPPEMVEEVFRRGYSTKTTDGHLGIGLALARLICTRRGGDITVRCGPGAVFTARLPVRARTAPVQEVTA